MLSGVLRVCLILVALFFILLVIRRVNQRKLLLQHSLLWLVLSALMIVVAIFPGIAVFFTRLVHIKEPSNFVYACGLFVLLFISFDLTGKISKQTSYLRSVIQSEAIDRFMMEKK